MRILIALVTIPLLVSSAFAQDDSGAITKPQHKPGSGCSFPTRLTDVMHPGDMTVTTFCFHIDADGRVRDLLLLRPSGNEKMDRKLAGCIKQWEYIPAMKNGQPVEVPHVETQIMCFGSHCSEKYKEYRDSGPQEDLQGECEKKLADYANSKKRH